MKELPEFLRILKEKSPEFGEAILKIFEKQQSEGTLPAKVKTLIAMALDAAMAHPEGVKALAERARKQGATEEEIIETIQVVTVACGIQGLATGSVALK